MKSYILVALLVTLAIVVSSARVIDPVHQEDKATSLFNAQLEESFGSLAHLSQVAGENDHGSQNLNRQKRDWIKMLAVLTFLNNMNNGNGGGGGGGGNNDPIIVDEPLRNAGNNRATSRGSSNVGNSGYGNAQTSQGGIY